MRVMGAGMTANNFLQPASWGVVGGDLNFIESPTDRTLFVDLELKNGSPNPSAARCFQRSVAQPHALREITQDRFTLVARNGRFVARNDRVYASISEGAALGLDTRAFIPARPDKSLSDHSPVLAVIEVPPLPALRSLPRQGVNHESSNEEVTLRYNHWVGRTTSPWERLSLLHLAFWEAACDLSTDVFQDPVDPYARFEQAHAMFRKLANPPSPDAVNYVNWRDGVMSARARMSELQHCVSLVYDVTSRNITFEVRWGDLEALVVKTFREMTNLELQIALAEDTGTPATKARVARAEQKLSWVIPGGKDQFNALEDDDGEIHSDGKEMFDMCASFWGGRLSPEDLPPFDGHAFHAFTRGYPFKLPLFDPPAKGAAFDALGKSVETAAGGDGISHRAYRKTRLLASKIIDEICEDVCTPSSKDPPPKFSQARLVLPGKKDPKRSDCGLRYLKVTELRPISIHNFIFRIIMGMITFA